MKKGAEEEEEEEEEGKAAWDEGEDEEGGAAWGPGFLSERRGERSEGERCFVELCSVQASAEGECDCMVSG